MRHVKVKSGLTGWQGELKKSYNSFSEFESYCEPHRLHIRLGYSTPEEAWEANPVVQGSTNPDDFQKAKVTERQKTAILNRLESQTLALYGQFGNPILDPDLKKVKKILAKINRDAKFLLQ